MQLGVQRRAVFARLADVKSSFELAMERLSRQAPTQKLSTAQKQQIVELDSVYQARIAQKDLTMQEEVARFQAAGDAEKADEARARFLAEKQSLETEREEKKERIRSKSGK